MRHEPQTGRPGVVKVGGLAFWQGPHGETRMYVADKRERKYPDDPQVIASITAETIAMALLCKWVVTDNQTGHSPSVDQVAKVILEAIYGPCRGARE